MSNEAAEEPELRPLSTAPETILAGMDERALRQHLGALQSVTEATLAHLVLPALLDELLGRLRALLRADTASVLLCTPGGRTLVVRASKGLEEEVEQHVEIPFGQGIAGTVAIRRHAVIVDDVSRVQTVSPALRRLSSMMVAPLVAEGGLLGVLHVGSFQPRRFLDPELYLLQVVADRVALSIRNALTHDRLLEEAERRTRAETALSRSELRYRSFFASNPDPAFALNPDGCFIAANIAATRVSGYSEEEMLGQPFLPLIAPEQRDRARAAFDKALSGQPQSIETTILARSGERRELRVAVIPAHEDEAVTGVFGVAEDLTERRRAETALRERQARLDALLSQRTAGIAETDLTGRFVTVNDRFCEMLGRSREEILRLRMQDVTHPDDLPGNAELFRRLIGGGPDFAVEKRYFRPDGSSIWVHNSVLGVRDPQGELRFVVAVVQDVTDRKLAEAERVRALEHLEFLASASRELSSSLDFARTLDTVAHLAVPALADWCFVHELRTDGTVALVAVGHSDPELEAMARETLQRYPVDTAAPHGTGRVILTGEPELVPDVTGRELQAVARDAEHLELLRRAGFRSYLTVPLRVHGRVIGALAVAQAESGRRFTADDLPLMQGLALRAAVAMDNARLYREAREELRRREEAELTLREQAGHLQELTIELEELAEEAQRRASEAEEANRVKADFLAAMSHELRTPINAVIGYSDLLDAGVPEPIPEGARRQVSRIQLASRHLLSLVEEILTYSRLEAGHESVDARSFDVRDVVEQVQAIVEPLASARELRFVVTVPGAPLPITSDERKLRQILLNLLDNAVKFTPRGEIELRAWGEGGETYLQVRDTGPGIAPENRAKIFEPFWQVDQSKTRTAGGTGLGLAVASGHAKSLGGELSVQSELGQGATFTLRLPARVLHSDD